MCFPMFTFFFLFFIIIIIINFFLRKKRIEKNKDEKTPYNLVYIESYTIPRYMLLFKILKE